MGRVRKIREREEEKKGGIGVALHRQPFAVLSAHLYVLTFEETASKFQAVVCIIDLKYC